MFDVLNTPIDERQCNLDEDLAALPYVNGELFAERLNFADFNGAMRTGYSVAATFDGKRSVQRYSDLCSKTSWLIASAGRLACTTRPSATS